MRGRVETAVGTRASLLGRGRSGEARSHRVWVRQRLGLAVALVALVLASARGARAQTTATSVLRSPNGDITLYPNSQGIERCSAASLALDGCEETTDHPQSRPWWISYKDCIDQDVFRFSLDNNVSGYNLEIWAGTQDCALGRSNVSTIGQCWLVGMKTLQEDTEQIEVPVRNVAARRTGIATLPGPLGPEVCDDSTEVNGEAIGWYFIVVKGGQGAEYFAWNGDPGGSGIDVVGPSPPGRISVGVGESQLAINLDDIPTDASRERYEAFCVPEGTLRGPLEPSSDAGTGATVDNPVANLLDAGDAGSSELDASASDAGGTPLVCGSDVLRVGERPPTESVYSCGTTNAISGTLRTKRLTNYLTYAVAVSGQDDLGNAGVISEIECGRPVVLDDFYEMYSRAGGPGGGGFCSFSPDRRATGAGSAGVALLLLAGLGWRRARGRA